jgi:hypothetical protein
MPDGHGIIRNANKVYYVNSVYFINEEPIRRKYQEQKTNGTLAYEMHTKRPCRNLQGF